MGQVEIVMNLDVEMRGRELKRRWSVESDSKAASRPHPPALRPTPSPLQSLILISKISFITD